ncbi:helix-turn-helix transcriptional regulator [Neobacillus sp. MM2021_6]|uniref:helix-turn-helix domain-containing protein n=1 Tax=Bacillaceae TaxID=186817 RepID=UPI00140C9557|nr:MULTISPECIES: helix-turn-helix transcriptional regulator [Bacillaceae]MBO0959939.1 helix-turn-helix transcriptional regulator [Neobacillus sp. MM2021_6]NHC18888.1 helix-turn-helix transcriptional regulator [Bacillus sp. MM2020_4]
MENHHLPYIGTELKNLRKDKNFTQLELSCRCHINRPHISSIERNVKQPMLRTIFLLAAGLGMTASELVQEIEKYL